MGTMEERGQAATLAEGDIIAILLQQHARIRELFAHIRAAEGEHKKQAFDELRALLAVHETGEEMILRPVSRRVAGEDVADARNREEDEASRLLAELEDMDVSAPEFDAKFLQLETAVLQHASREESEEFPRVREGCDEDERIRMGTALRTVEKIAPTHPHPTLTGSTAAQWTVGPFASLVDRTRDALKAATTDK